MKHKTLWWLFSSLIILSLALSACATPTPEVIRETVEVERTVVVEKTVEVEVPVEVEAEPEEEGTLPRQETLYFNGQQWGAVVGWNPYSSSNNNAMAISEGASARVTMFETPYLFNMLDGQVYPLLADGDYEWNEDRTEITFKLKEAAQWSDGTPVTAEDVAYTWDTHVKYNTGAGAGNAPYIEDIVAADDKTVVVKAKLNEDGEAVNPLIVEGYLCSNYVMQKAWTQTLEERVGEDPTEFLADPAEDVVYS
ncbi:MAG: ABC transporter substrate-binding protein, partial [Anaerolineae bacterium]